MRTLRWLVCMAALPIGSWAQTSGSGADSTAARDLIARYMKARNDKNADELRSLFTPDADQLVSTGDWRKGLDNLLRGAMASSQREAGKSTVDVDDVRFITRDVALVDGRYRTQSLSGASREMWSTFVLKRTGDGWRIAAIRNMLPVPPASPAH